MLLRRDKIAIGVLVFGSTYVYLAVTANAQESPASDRRGISGVWNDTDEPIRRGVTKKEAIASVRHVLGQLPRETVVRHEALIDSGSLNLPFIRQKVVRQQAHHVVVQNWRMLPGSEYQDGKHFSRIWDVFVSADDGQVLRIASRWPAQIPRKYPEPSAESTEKQMARTPDELGTERYHGIPNVPPLMSFSEALDATGFEEPVRAQQIVGQYVTWSIKGTKWDEPRPVWAITLWGIPPFEAGYPGIVPEHHRDHIRYIVDPVSKKWLCATSTPQPDQVLPQKD